ncbi:ATP-binding protein [Halorussus salinisoli]|uniref:ATP-binding protein n=1 Tax=Halorussus salinisoli TaxID=2558242 RepID=UPI0010C1FC5C|nr:HAMP domain-containing sensor histidine kinase [Halorussus salinisoli]
MNGREITERISRAAVVGLGTSQGLLAVLYYTFESTGRPFDLLKLAIPLFLSLAVITLGVGLFRSETRATRVAAVAVSGLTGMVLLGVVSSFTLAVERLEGGGVAEYRYLVLSNASIGTVVGTLLGVYRVRLQQRTEQLANEVSRLDEFAGIVAHDLRNPLHIAQGYLGQLDRRGNEEEIATIEQSHARMERLIEHVLDLSRRGDAIGETNEVGVESVARTAWSDVPTDDAELRLRTDRTIDVDERRLQSLFENLFRNAVEHGLPDQQSESDAEHRDEGITVTVGEFEDGFYVADDGRGISPERRERIFEGGYSSHETGTGLGLAIVRQIADAHDWTIDVTESESGGARFEFAL